MLTGLQELLSPPPNDVLAALDRICTSPPFENARKLTCFLRFAVEATLSGDGGRLKGYTIGVGALGRGEDFDPQTNPIVRVEANRLRAALDRYYAGAGAGDPVIIEMPRGRYVPYFRWRHPPARWGALTPAMLIRSLRRFLSLRITLQVTSDPR